MGVGIFPVGGFCLFSSRGFLREPLYFIGKLSQDL